MARTKDIPGINSYYQVLQDIVHLEADGLTGVLPHLGERGRNDEERLRTFLARVLPRRFAIGTGFIVCSASAVPPSNQTDVVLFDEVHNSPLHREYAADVYPVEMVYGTVEVKASLTRAELLKACGAIRKVRELGQHQYYVDYVGAPKNPAHPEQRVSVAMETRETTPPRSFIFAYGKRNWRRIDDLVESLRDAVGQTGAHVHGLVILSANWYVAQEAYADGRVFHAKEGDALMRFVRGMLHSIGSRRVRPMSINRYLRVPTSPEVEKRPPRATTRKQHRSRKSGGRSRS